MTYEDFKHRYAVLAIIESTENNSKKVGEKMCASLVKSGKFKPDDFQCGLTKVKI